MRLTIRLLGTEVLHISTDSDEQQPGPEGEVTTYPVGFTAHMEAEAITHLAFRASREIPAVGTEEFPTPWDRRHGAVNELLSQLEVTLV
jgi:hypothetical protein